jgi:hypothetical protein
MCPNATAGAKGTMRFPDREFDIRRELRAGLDCSPGNIERLR